jgi:hypothetical protein
MNILLLRMAQGENGMSQTSRIFLIILVWLIALSVFSIAAHAAQSVTVTNEGGVEVVRGYNDFAPAPIAVSKLPQANPARQWFKEYEFFRQRLINCRVNPDGRGRGGC